MTTKTVARCGIYESRPDVCREYPHVDHWTPPNCGFSFAGSERTGACDCDVAACCMTARENGEPGGAPLPETAGGLPCKHVVWVDEPTEEAPAVEKTAAGNAASLLMEAVRGE